MTDARRLMAVLAHPDDESLGLGGTLARCAADGVEVVLVTATRGESGRYRGLRRGAAGHPGPEALATIREAELSAAARVLGVRELHLLGYRDGALDEAPPAEAVARIAHHIRAARPQVVVTFPPDGGYGHPDHIAISQFASAAVVAAANPAHAEADLPPHAASKLYYLAWPERAWAAYHAASNTPRSVVDGVTREAVPWPEWALTTVLDARAHWPTVWEAVQCHESQVSAYEGLRDLPPGHHEALWGWQWFYRAFSTVNGGRRRETDLFEGVRA